MYAVAPGYIVIARLPGRGAPILKGEVLNHLLNWPGFVVLRHEITERKPDGTDGQVGVLYSLSMHLMPPAWGTTKNAGGKPEVVIDSEAEEPYLLEIPWFKSLWERRHGAFVRVANVPSGPNVPLGTVVWAAEKVGQDSKGTLDKAQYKVWDKQLRAVDIKAPGTDVVQWMYKPAPATLTLAAHSLAEGKTVTFGEPFFPVAKGDAIGFVSELPPDVYRSRKMAYSVEIQDESGKKTKEEHRVGVWRSGFLHLQFFAPEGAAADKKVNGVDLLVRLAEGIADGMKDNKGQPIKAPRFFPIEDAGEDANKGPDGILSHSEIETRFKQALPEEDGKRFEKAFADMEKTQGRNSVHLDFGYAHDIVAMMDGDTSFAPKAEAALDWAVGCSMAYPVELQIDAQRLPPPNKNSLADGKYTLNIAFEKGRQSAPAVLQCTERCDRESCGGGALAPRAPPASASTSEPASTSEAAPAPTQPCAPKPLVLDQGNFNSRLKDGVLTLRLSVPADADRMKVTGGPGLFIGAEKSPDASMVVLLSDALKERWRNTKLTGIMEWAPKVINAIHKKVKEAGITLPLGTEEFAWSQADTTVAIGRKDLDEGDTNTIFAGALSVIKRVLGSGPGLISVDGKIVSLHPVTALWLLNLLERAKKLSVNSTFKRESFDTFTSAPFSIGWVTAQPSSDEVHEVSLGETVHALVVDDEFEYDQARSLKLLATSGNRQLVLAAAAPYGAGGVISLPVTTCFWGEWALKSSPSESWTGRIFGSKRIKVPAPEFADYSAEEKAMHLDMPRKLSNGGFLWMLKVKGRPPAELEGVVGVQVKKEKGEWPAETAREKVLLPAVARASNLSAEDRKALEDVPRNREALSLEGNFIVGLKPAAAAASAPAQKVKPIDATKLEVAAGITLAQFQTASKDIKLACSLLAALQAVRGKTGQLKVVRISRSGLELQVRALESLPAANIPLPEAGKEDEGPFVRLAKKVLGSRGVTVERPKQMSSPASIDEVVLRMDRGALESLSQCDELKSKAGALIVDAEQRFILGATGAQVADSFPLGEVTEAYRAGGGEFRLSVALARGLESLKRKGCKLTLAHLSSDGVSCRISGSAKVLAEAAEAARASGLFGLVEQSGEVLSLVASPDAAHSLFVAVNAEPLFRHLSTREDIKPGEPVQYRFVFETANGIHLLSENGECPLHGDSVTSDVYSKHIGGAEVKRSSPSWAAGSFEKLQLCPPTLTWATVGGVPSVVVDVALLGSAALWQGYELHLFRWRKATAGKASAEPKPGNAKPVQKVKVQPSVTTYQFKVPVTKDEDFRESNVFRVEAIPAVSVNKGAIAVRPLPVQEEIDCHPRWLTDSIIIEDSVDNELSIACLAAGVEVAEFVGEQWRKNDNLPEFEIVVKDLSPLSPASASVDVTAAFELPNNTGAHGFLDRNGWIRARIPLALAAKTGAVTGAISGTATPGKGPLAQAKPNANSGSKSRSKSLSPGSYEISVQRPAGLQVRGKPFSACSVKKYCYEAKCDGQCPPPASRFVPTSFDFLKGLAPLIRAYSQRYRVPPVAAAGILAEAHTAKTLKEMIRKSLERYQPFLLTELEGASKLSPLPPVPEVRVTAGDVVDRFDASYRSSFSDGSAGPTRTREEILRFLDSGEAAVQVAALGIKTAQDALRGRTLGFPRWKREAELMNQYWRGNKSPDASQMIGPNRRHPDDGCWVCLQREQFLSALGIQE